MADEYELGSLGYAEFISWLDNFSINISARSELREPAHTFHENFYRLVALAALPADLAGHATSRQVANSKATFNTLGRLDYQQGDELRLGAIKQETIRLSSQVTLNPHDKTMTPRRFGATVWRLKSPKN